MGLRPGRWTPEALQDRDAFAAVDALSGLTPGQAQSSLDDAEDWQRWLCGTCGHLGQFQAEGYLVCGSCGLTADTVFDTAGEWSGRFGDGKPDQSRCGIPTNPLLPEVAGRTVLAASADPKLRRLHMWTTAPRRDAAKWKIYRRLQDLRGLAPAIVRQSQEYAVAAWDLMQEQGRQMRGANRQALLAACVSRACSKLDGPRSESELSVLFDLRPPQVSHGLQLFEQLFQGSRRVGTTDNLGRAEAVAVLIPRYCSRLMLGQPAAELAVAYAKAANDRGGLDRYVLDSVAAGCIWFAVKKLRLERKIRRGAVAEACGVAETTVTKSASVFAEVCA